MFATEGSVYLGFRAQILVQRNQCMQLPVWPVLLCFKPGLSVYLDLSPRASGYWVVPWQAEEVANITRQNNLSAVIVIHLWVWGTITECMLSLRNRSPVCLTVGTVVHLRHFTDSGQWFSGT
jgi:hypothetical protein